MYNVEKHSDDLENAASFVRRDAYLRSRSKMAALGYVYTYIGETNFAFPRTLHRSECHWNSFLRGSDTTAHPRV